MSESEAQALADSINAGAFPYVEGYKKRIAELVSALEMAINEVSDCWMYCSPHLQAMYALKGVVCRLEKVLKGETP